MRLAAVLAGAFAVFAYAAPAASPISTPPRLVVTGSATPAAGVTIGSTVDYTFSFWNTGGQAVSVTFSDALPANVIPIAAAPTSGSCSTRQTVTCWLGSIGSGRTVTVTIATQVVKVGAFLNGVTVSPSDPSVPAAVVTPIQVFAADATPVSFPATTKSRRK